MDAFTQLAGKAVWIPISKLKDDESEVAINKHGLFLQMQGVTN
jgi:hypothetical protein